MFNEITERALKQSEGLLKRLEAVYRFETKHRITPTKEFSRVAEDMQKLVYDLPEIEAPQNEDELLQSELRRRMKGESAQIEQQLSGKLYDFDTVIGILGIPPEDIDSLRPWLESNKSKTQEAIDRLFHSKDIEGFELPVYMDIPPIKRQAEELALANVGRYHKTLGAFLQGLTKVGEFLRDINAVATAEGRSYFNQNTNTLALGIPAICFSKEDGSLHIKERELIRLYGHEGMGHALNFTLTRASTLPYFLKKDSQQTVATAESVAQFYERVLIEDLRNSPETQRKLGIQHKFADIYQETKDTEQLEEHNRKMFQYGIIVLADKSLGHYDDPAVLRKKAEKLEEVAVDKGSIQSWVQKNRYEFDAEGNLAHRIVGELRYCVQPVTRALEEFRKQRIDYDERGRSAIDSTFLKGLWTPQGFVDNARLRSKTF